MDSWNQDVSKVYSMKPERTKYQRGKPDGWLFHFLGKTSYFIEKDHLLIVNLILVIDKFTKVRFDDIRQMTVTKVNSPTGCILCAISLLVASLPAITSFCLYVRFRQIITTYDIVILASASTLIFLLTLIGWIRSLISKETSIVLTTYDGIKFAIELRDPQNTCKKFTNRLVEAIEANRSK